MASRPGDPVDYTCPFSQDRYFDPTNRVYSAALAVLAPELSTGELCATVTNNVSRGDICESLLGYAYLVEQGLTSADLTSEALSAVQVVASLVNECSWLCYWLARRVSSWDSFYKWISWVNATVAWRKDVPASLDLVVVLSSETTSLPTVKHGILEIAGSGHFDVGPLGA